MKRAVDRRNQQPTGHPIPLQFRKEKKTMRHIVLEPKTPTTKREFEVFEPFLHKFLRCIVIYGETVTNQNIGRVGVSGRDGLVTRIAGWIWNESEFTKYSNMFNIIEQY